MSEYKSPEELFADIGIKFIDCDETDEKTIRDDDTSVSSFSSTYQTPSSAEGEGGKMTRDLSREIQESGDLRHELAKHVDIASLNTSEISCRIYYYLLSLLELSTNVSMFQVIASILLNIPTPVQEVVFPILEKIPLL